MPCPDDSRRCRRLQQSEQPHGGDKKQEERHLILHYFLSSSLCLLCNIACLFFAPYSTSYFGTIFAAAASLNFLHSLRCPPCFQWFTWHSRPQYCTVWHNLQGCNGRNGVLGLPQVEQQRMVGVVRPSCLSNF